MFALASMQATVTANIGWVDYLILAKVYELSYCYAILLGNMIDSEGSMQQAVERTSVFQKI